MAVRELGLAVKMDVVVLGEATVNVMFAFRFTEPTVAVRVSACATVLVTVAVNTPLLFLGPDVGVNVFVPVPVSETV